jgi:hypothetical protein
MIRYLLAVASLGAVLFSGLSVSSLRADEWDKKTDMTIHQSINVDGKVLTPGEYVLKLMDSESDRHVVQIFDQNQQHLITTVLAFPAYRLEPTGKPVFTFYETPAGQVPALQTYFYPGDEDGFQFPDRP